MKLELIPVVRYWDYNSKEIFAALERFRANGVSTIAAWVPWSHLETDRHHLLQKFLKQAAVSGLAVRLGVTPENGIGYASGGVPDELQRDRQNLAQDRLGQPIYACVPPNIHPMVSLLAPAVFQRYGHFLLKLSQEIAEVYSEGFTGELDLVVTDSFFKHYRNAGLPASDHGDFSLRHVQFGGGLRKEDWTPALAERIFHSRAFDFLQSRFSQQKNVKVVSRAVSARDSSFGRLLEELIGSGPSLGETFRALAEARCSSSLAWLDDLRLLRDRERNFLVSSALMLFGELWLSESDFFALSPAFRKKVDKLVLGFGSEETEQARPAVAFVKNRYSPARVSCLLRDKIGAGLRFLSSLSELTEEDKKRTRLYAVEEGYQLELRQTMDLLDLARERDCTVVIFRSSLCEAGFQEFHKLKTFRLNHGWLFEIGLLPSGGHVLLIEGQESAQLSMDTLGDSLLSVARVEPLCSFDRSKSPVFSLSVDWNLKDETELEKAQGMMKTLFLINPSAQAEKLTLEFPKSVRIHGLQAGSGASAEVSEAAHGKCFETELPPLSVIPLSVFVESERAEAEKGKDGTEAELA
jgi:hypothetical protein